MQSLSRGFLSRLPSIVEGPNQTHLFYDKLQESCVLLQRKYWFSGKSASTVPVWSTQLLDLAFKMNPYSQKILLLKDYQKQKLIWLHVTIFFFWTGLHVTICYTNFELELYGKHGSNDSKIRGWLKFQSNIYIQSQ